MSTFEELSQRIGVAVHKATKEGMKGFITEDAIKSYVYSNSNVQFHIAKLVEHTIKNTGDNEE